MEKDILKQFFDKYPVIKKDNRNNFHINKNNLFEINKTIDNENIEERTKSTNIFLNYILGE